jgi:hypothetical protein
VVVAAADVADTAADGRVTNWLWKKPFMDFFHDVDQGKRRRFPRSTSIAFGDV